jgi:hypothetical protein
VGDDPGETRTLLGSLYIATDPWRNSRALPIAASGVDVDVLGAKRLVWRGQDDEVLIGAVLYDMWGGDLLRFEVEEIGGIEREVMISVEDDLGGQASSQFFRPRKGLQVELARERGLAFAHSERWQLWSRP